MMRQRKPSEETERGMLQRRIGERWPLFLILLVLTFLVSASVGKYSISIPDIISTIFYHFTNPELVKNVNMETTLFNIRIPRIIAVILVGGGLSMAGASYQGMFKNPMVSPDILGASAGAALGACIGMLLGWNTYLVQLCSFVTGLASVFLAANLTGKLSQDPILGLVLGGIMVSTFCNAGTSMIKLMADAEDKLPQITFWLMGGFNTVNKARMFSIIIPMAIGYITLFCSRWQLNVMSFGENEARSMGIRTGRTRAQIIFASTLITASSVSVCGLVGWVGLVIPHIARAIIGPNYRYLLPTTTILGAVFLMVVDDVARCLFEVELPIGILTSFIGVPFFYCVLKYNRGKGDISD